MVCVFDLPLILLVLINIFFCHGGVKRLYGNLPLICKKIFFWFIFPSEGGTIGKAKENEAPRFPEALIINSMGGTRIAPQNVIRQESKTRIGN
jgi:hypothetical protein